MPHWGGDVAAANDRVSDCYREFMSWDPLTWLASITSLKWSGNADGGSYVGAAPVSEKFRTVQSMAPPPNELFPELHNFVNPIRTRGYGCFAGRQTRCKLNSTHGSMVTHPDLTLAEKRAILASCARRWDDRRRCLGVEAPRSRIRCRGWRSSVACFPPF